MTRPPEPEFLNDMETRMLTVVVRKKDGSRCKYAANITNMEVHWEAAILQHEVVSGRYEK